MNARLVAHRESGRRLLAWLKRTVAVGLLVLVGLTGTNVAVADVFQPTSPPIRMATSLRGPWQATLDPQEKGEREEYFKPDFAPQGWKDVNVPASFANVAPEIDRYEGVGWFRKSFRLPAQWKGWRVTLMFKGVNNHAKIWLNGQLAGENSDAFLPFEVPISSALRFDGDNMLVIRVDNTRRRDEIPGGRQGWHPYGGILREVEAVATHSFRLGGMWVSAEPQAEGGRFTVRAKVVNGRDEPAQGRLKIHWPVPYIGPDLYAETDLLEAGQDRIIEVAGTVPHVKAWSPEQPEHYNIEVYLMSGEQIIDVKGALFGFRKIEARGERLYLNGKPIFLTGFNRHEDSPRTDMCPDPELTRKELMQMKAMGCNFIRLCHYPQHPWTLHLCDEIGLLAMCEIPLYMWPGLEEGLDNYRGTVESARRQLTKMIECYYNHPSVIFWSVSNEVHTQHPEVRGTNVMLIQQARRLDPTRLAVHVSDHWQQGDPRADSFGEDDVICLNGYPNPKDGPAWWTKRLEDLHREYPGKPILITEFGGEADRPIEWQIGRLKAGFEGTTAPYVCGTTIWCWADHPWDKTWLEPPLSPYGVFSRDRKPRASVEIARQGFLDRQRQFQSRTK
jgi:beta-galactosidase/beta-glucuronidase